jgi:hypothetical protein
MKIILDVLFVVSLFGFILSYFAYMMLKEDPDNSKVGKFIEKYKKHIKKFYLAIFIFLLLAIISGIFLNYLL